MGTDNLFTKNRIGRRARKQEVQNKRKTRWLIICESSKTEPNYFKGLVAHLNANKETAERIKVDIKGTGKIQKA
jgi:hypothetical protein